MVGWGITTFAAQLLVVATLQPQLSPWQGASWRTGVLGVTLGVILGFIFWGVFMGSFVVVGRQASWLRGGLRGRLRGRLHGGFMVVFGGSFVVVFVASSGRCQPLLTLLSALSGVGIGEMMAGVEGDMLWRGRWERERGESEALLFRVVALDICVTDASQKKT